MKDGRSDDLNLAPSQVHGHHIRCASSLATDREPPAGPELVKEEWMKPGATVIDVGLSRVPTSEGKTTRLIPTPKRLRSYAPQYPVECSRERLRPAILHKRLKHLFVQSTLRGKLAPEVTQRRLFCVDRGMREA